MTQIDVTPNSVFESINHRFNTIATNESLQDLVKYIPNKMELDIFKSALNSLSLSDILQEKWNIIVPEGFENLVDTIKWSQVFSFHNDMPAAVFLKSKRPLNVWILDGVLHSLDLKNTISPEDVLLINVDLNRIRWRTQINVFESKLDVDMIGQTIRKQRYEKAERLRKEHLSRNSVKNKSATQARKRAKLAKAAKKKSRGK